jgi:hypothetical protein
LVKALRLKGSTAIINCPENLRDLEARDFG